VLLTLGFLEKFGIEKSDFLEKLGLWKLQHLIKKYSWIAKKRGQITNKSYDYYYSPQINGVKNEIFL